MKKLIAFPLLLIIFTLHAQKSDTAGNSVITGVDTTIYNKVDTEAVFLGGKQGWISFVQKNLNPSVPADNGAKKGKYIIWVRFIVTQDGHVKNISAETKKGYGLEEEAIRMMLLSPNWIPAKLNGKPVNSYKRISQELM